MGKVKTINNREEKEILVSVDYLIKCRLFN